MAADVTAEDLLLNDIFIEYCLNATPANTAKWEAMMTDNKIPAQVIEQARAMLTMLTPAIANHEIEEEVLKLSDTIYSREAKRRKTVLRITVAAAIAIVTATLAFFTLQTDIKKNTTTLARSYQTSTGEQKRIILPDGTVVILNSNTNVSLGENYNSKDRKMYLKGSAFFKVSNDMSRPFSVISDDFSTTALGTSFYVNADSSHGFSVKLLEGKVKVNAGKTKATAYLNPGQELQYSPANAQFVKQDYDTSYLNKWISGQIIFRNTRVDEAFAILEQWYGVEIIDSRDKRTDIAINGTYEKVLLEDILKVITFSLSCRYRYEVNRIIIE